MNPKISVITISYNNKAGLEKTFESVTTQDYKDFEYIVIDGGSKDGSKELLEKYTDQITYWISEPDKGIYDALNKGISQAKGIFTVFINSGDSLYAKDVLSKLAVIDESYDVVSGDVNLVLPNGKNQVKKHENCSLKFLLTNTPHHQGSRIRTELLKMNLYRMDYKIISDWAWFFDRYIENKKFLQLDEITSNFTLDGISSLQPELLKKERQDFLNKNHPEFALINEELNRLADANMQLKMAIKKIYSSRAIQLLKKFKLTKL